MNAGAYGGEMKQVLKNASVLTPEGGILTLTADEMKMGYRTSIVSRMDYVVLEAVLTLTPGSREEIRGRMEELKEQRVSKQPLEYGSAGSTFKRPEGYFAGKLIQDAGLRGSPGRIFRRETDPGCGLERLPCGERPGVGEALRLRDQPGRGDREGSDRTDG